MTQVDLLLAAGIGDFLGVLLPIVFFVIFLINQLLAARRNPQQPQRGAPQRPRAERAMRPPQAGGREAPRGQAAELNEEVEQFLKRASQRRGENQPRQRAARPPESRPRVKQPPAPPRPPLREAPLDADVVLLDEPRRESVAASVEKHLQTGSFEKRAAHLAGDVARAKEQMEEHLQSAFSRRVGTLGDTPAATGPVTDAAVDDAPSAAAGFAQLLRTPQGMREAVVLGEILARPEQRW